MKKIELKLGSVKETLTREQMKQINGGVLGPWCTVGIDTTNNECDGRGDENGEWGYECTDATVEYCQGYADGTCEQDVCCTGVICYTFSEP